MNRFFTADWHLYHQNIIEYTNRPWKDTNQMHQQLIYNNNQLVSPEDELWFLGDVCLMSPEFVGKVRKVVEKFNGVKHIVLGNHDEWKAQHYIAAGFNTAHTAMWLEHDGKKFYMMHDPATYTVIQNEPNSFLLCGHIHNLFKHLLPDKRVINVGVDVWEYSPVSIDQIVKLIADQERR